MDYHEAEYESGMETSIDINDIGLMYTDDYFTPFDAFIIGQWTNHGTGTWVGMQSSAAQVVWSRER